MFSKFVYIKVVKVTKVPKFGLIKIFKRNVLIIVLKVMPVKCT